MVDIKDKFYRLCDDYIFIRIGIPVLSAWSSLFIVEFITKSITIGLTVCVLLYAISSYHTIVRSSLYMRSIRNQEFIDHTNDDSYMIYTIDDRKE
jgi:hypothetical protein